MVAGVAPLRAVCGGPLTESPPTEEIGNWLNLLKSLIRGSVHREAISLDQSLIAKARSKACKGGAAANV